MADSTQPPGISPWLLLIPKTCPEIFWMSINLHKPGSCQLQIWQLKFSAQVQHWSTLTQPKPLLGLLLWVPLPGFD